MKIKSLLVALATLLGTLTLLQGCAVYTPHGAVVVDPDGDGGGRRGGGGGQGRFCPPGQAKKGNC